jgi:hypothetical protein
MRYSRKSIILLLILIFPILPGSSQYDKPIRKKHSGDIGIGAGIDYGGFGIQINQVLGPVCFIGGYGYNKVYFLPFGGIKYYLPFNIYENYFAPYLKVIYGYNSVIIIKYGPKDFYYGFTPGIGTNIRFGKRKSYGFNLDLNIPIRTKKYKKDFETYRLLYGNIKQSFLPILISLGVQASLD